MARKGLVQADPVTISVSKQWPQASMFIEAIETPPQGMTVNCPEETAGRAGWIHAARLLEVLLLQPGAFAAEPGGSCTSLRFGA